MSFWFLVFWVESRCDQQIQVYTGYRGVEDLYCWFNAKTQNQKLKTGFLREVFL
jgi:hypothetical protein